MSTFAGRCLVTRAANGAASTPPTTRPAMIGHSVRPMVKQEGCGNRQGDEELGEVDGPDRIAWRCALPEQRRGDDRTPPAAANRIEDSADEAQRSDPARRRRDDRTSAYGLPKDEQAQQQQIAADVGPDDLAWDRGQHVGADGAADHAGDGQSPDQAAIDVAEPPMRKAGRTGREDFGRMHRGAGGGRRNADAQQHGGRRHAVGHADGAIDHLRGKAHRHEKEKILPHPELSPSLTTMWELAVVGARRKRSWHSCRRLPGA